MLRYPVPCYDLLMNSTNITRLCRSFLTQGDILDLIKLFFQDEKRPNMKVSLSDSATADRVMKGFTPKVSLVTIPSIYTI